jgi:hypothetical protein
MDATWMKHDMPNVRTQLKPRRGVFANEKFPIGKLVLVPLGNVMLELVDCKKIPMGAIKLNGHTVNNAVGKPMQAYIVPRIELPSSQSVGYGVTKTTEVIVVPFCFAHTTIDLKLANVEIATTTITCNDHNWKVPVMKNTKIIQPGAELMIYKQAPSKSIHIAPPKAKSEEGEASAATAAPKAKAKAKPKAKSAVPQSITGQKRVAEQDASTNSAKK